MLIFLARSFLAWLLSDRLSSSSLFVTGIVAKRCEIRPRLLLITNRKSHIGF